MSKETFQFQTEAQKLLKLMINSLYSSREVFLRELISNASDAIDKLRFEALANPDITGGDEDYAIEITTDDKAKQITISDNGIGMSQEEVIQNLGTIAKSGTEDFLVNLTGDQKTDSNLIGQFGVGFYSAFLVADEVVVETRRADADSGVRWMSKGEFDFNVEPWQRQRGTTIKLQLKDDAVEFLGTYRLRELVTSYSDHVAFPVKMESLGEEKELEVVNSSKALWTRPRNELKEEDYKDFYQHIANDFEEPYLWYHNRVEGKIDYTSLLYVPKHAPWDLWHNSNAKGLKLYAKRVFIMDDDGELLPSYLRWVKGVVDISELPLNMSRETLMADAGVTSIKNAVVKRVMDGLVKASKDDPEKYLEFWDSFGSYMKASFDWVAGPKDQFLKLLRFMSTASDEDKQERTLSEYVEAMPEEQDKIYFLVGDSIQALRSHPLLEVYAAKGTEVLLLADDYDSWTMQSLTEFEGKSFQDVAIESENAPELEEQETEGDEEGKKLIEQLKESLGEAVEDVVASKRLTDALACVRLKQPPVSRGLRVAAGITPIQLPSEKPVLEVNMQHPLVGYLRDVQEEGRFAEISNLILDQARLASGATDLPPSSYVQRVNNLLVDLLN